jgi:hypothetical protein
VVSGWNIEARIGGRISGIGEPAIANRDGGLARKPRKAWQPLADDGKRLPFFVSLFFRGTAEGQ